MRHARVAAVKKIAASYDFEYSTSSAYLFEGLSFVRFSRPVDGKPERSSVPAEHFNVLEGTWGGVPFIEADRLERGKGSVSIRTFHELSAGGYRSVMVCASDPLPAVLIIPRNVNFPGAPREGDQFELEAFNEWFSVEAADRLAAHALVDARVMQAILENPEDLDLCYETGPHGALIECSHLLEPNQIPALLQAGAKFVRQIPHVAREYAAKPQDS